MVENSEDSRLWAREQVMSLRTYTHFGLNMRIEKVGANGERAAVGSHIQLCFSLEKKMRFGGGEMAFHRLEIRSKARNVAEVERKVLEKLSRHPRS